MFLWYIWGWDTCTLTSRNGSCNIFKRKKKIKYLGLHDRIGKLLSHRLGTFLLKNCDSCKRLLYWKFRDCPYIISPIKRRRQLGSKRKKGKNIENFYSFSVDLFCSGLTAQMLPISWNMDCKAITLLNYFLLARQAKPVIWQCIMI